MKARLTIFAAAMLVTALATAAQVAKPDFSGTWSLDKNRSFSNPAGLDQTMTISHHGSDLKMDAKLTTPQSQRDVREDWVLDGQEREVTPTGGAPGAKAKRKAYWLPDNRRLVLVEETTTVTPQGPAVQMVMRKLSLSSDGSTLTIDYYFDRPQGSGESKRVFLKR